MNKAGATPHVPPKGDLPRPQIHTRRATESVSPMDVVPAPINAIITLRAACGEIN